MAMLSPLPGMFFQLHIQRIDNDSNTTCLLQKYAFKESDAQEYVRAYIQNHNLQDGCRWLVVLETSRYFNHGFKYEVVARYTNQKPTIPTIRMIRDD